MRRLPIRHVKSCFSMIAAIVAVATTLGIAPVAAQIDSSDTTFNEAVQAVKDKNYRHAVKLFKMQAESNQHDAQFNLALLLQSGKGAPQDFLSAMIWAQSAQLGGIEAAEELSEELAALLPDDAIETVRKAVRSRLETRIENGDAAALTQFATFHLTMAEEPDFETAYVWFSISAALGLEGALAARDDARDNVEDEKIVALQREAGTIYEKLNIKLD